MTGLELAARCRARGAAIRRLKESLSDARERMTGTTAPLDKMPSGSGGDRFAAHAARVDDLTRRVKAEQKRQRDDKKALAVLCADMEERPRAVILLFYGEGLSASRVAGETGQAQRTVYHHLAQGRSILRQAEGAERLLPKGAREEEEA